FDALENLNRKEKFKRKDVEEIKEENKYVESSALSVGNGFIISSHFNPMFDGVLEVLVSLKKGFWASTKNSTVMFKENIPPNSLEVMKDYQKEEMGSGNMTIGVRTVGGKSGGRQKVLLSKSTSSMVELINSQIKQGAYNDGPKEAGKQLESKEASRQRTFERFDRALGNDAWVQAFLNSMGGLFNFWLDELNIQASQFSLVKLEGMMVLCL
ncbi:hypothetical protein Gorai_006209, partial [Gossypium raimondii]|nr:hypothetical protein [Gossypium raimondii]